MRYSFLQLTILIGLVFMTFGCVLAPNPAAISSNERNMTDAFVQTSQETPKIHVRASPKDLGIVLHQPVFVDLTIGNGYDQAIFLDLGANFREAFVFSIEFPNGTTQSIPAMQVEGLSLIGEVAVSPKAEYKQTLLLNEWFTPPTPGDYLVKGRIEGPATLEDGNRMTFNSTFQFKMTVMPEDIGSLEDVCKKIFGQLQRASNYAEAADAALALTYVNHSIATPFLKKAIISDKMVESVIINSLRVRGGSEAFEVLAFAIKEKPNSETAAQAISAMKWIEHHSADDDLKKEIKSFLQNRI